jgi:flagellar hook-associated protein 2
MSTTSTSATSAASLFGNTNWMSGNGFDVTTVVNDILNSERGPETEWKNEQTTLTSQESALQGLQSDLSSLDSSYQDLSDFSGVFANLAAMSSDSSVLSASAGSGASAGTHTIEVSSLASTSTAYSTELSSASSSFTGGDLVFQVGDGSQQTISLTGSNATLSAAASYITQQNAGVTASVVTDSSGARLVLTSSTSGSAGSINVISAPSGLGFTTAAGTDASLTVDGVPVTSSSNSVSGVIPGVTLNLNGTSSSPVTVGVSADTGSIVSAISSFVSAYNTAIGDLNAQLTPSSSSSSSSSSSGVLQDDSVVSDLQSQLLSVISTAAGDNSTYQTLAQLGISMNDNGTLSMDTSTLQSALTGNYAAVQSFFQDTSASSFSQSFQNLMSEMTDPTNSPIVLDLNSDQQNYNDLQDNIDNLELQLSDQQTLLTSEYSTINAELQTLPTNVNDVETLLGENTNNNNSSS